MTIPSARTSACRRRSSSRCHRLDHVAPTDREGQSPAVDTLADAAGPAAIAQDVCRHRHRSLPGHRLKLGWRLDNGSTVCAEYCPTTDLFESTWRCDAPGAGPRTTIPRPPRPPRVAVEGVCVHFPNKAPGRAHAGRTSHAETATVLQPGIGAPYHPARRALVGGSSGRPGQADP